MFPIQKKSPTTKHLDTSKFKKPKISLTEKFDDTCSKFRGFVNQIQLITYLQPKRYPIDELWVGLVRTLLTRQALSWFVPLFEKRSPILNDFELFLITFAKAFRKHDKIWWATTKIRSLGLRSQFVWIYG